jgi:hypothetical protein
MACLWSQGSTPSPGPPARRLLKREQLDLRITPYQVLATSGTDGLIEFVPSQVTAPPAPPVHGVVLLMPPCRHAGLLLSQQLHARARWLDNHL